ncbi:MAG: L-seryl-tRNA(Sec) selenium transferase [Gemmatimonadetes bacterium]|nr:L-seryl-tRNA(Sec) selenium transferase [Gemmatimonadota bacterium]
MSGDGRRALPSVDTLLRLPEIAVLVQSHPRNVVVAAVRDSVAAARHAGEPPEDWAADIAERVDQRAAPSLFPVVNATGVILHTNLGRAPLAPAALEAVTRIAAGYSNLELDAATGKRGSRLDHCASLIAETTGAEAGFVVNNAAGALVLALNALAAGREVVISRGELIEIGGSFRIPEILEKSGATLREVGTTNRTHLADYRRAIGPNTGAVLVVHRSNFAMDGFVATPEPAEIAEVARAAAVPLIHDVGSGLMVDLADLGLSGEPIVPAAVRVADLVVFSGDKLLGGPQAGLLAGRRATIEPLKKNPFARAMRTDKMTLAALEATLRLYRDPAAARRGIPVLAMLSATPERLVERATALAAAIGTRWGPELAEGTSAVGGGSFPEATLATTLVSVPGGRTGANALALALRLGDPSVMVRVDADRVVLDPRTIDETQVWAVGAAFARIE